MFTDRQAHDRGVTARMLQGACRAGRFVRVLPRTYRVTAVRRTFRSRAMAAALWSGGLVSHAAAARLWRAETMVARDVHVTVERACRRSHPLVTVHRTDDLLPADRAIADGIPVTSALRTVIDLAAVLEVDTLELVIEDGLRRGLFSAGQLRWRTGLRSGPGVPGGRNLDRLLARHLGDTDSGWELRVARILTHAGLPEPQRQIRFVTAAGERFVDLGYPGDRIVALEYDSDRWHSSVRQRHADAERRNGIRVGGGLVVEITPALVRRPAALVATVRSALAAAGHPMAIQGSLLGA